MDDYEIVFVWSHARCRWEATPASDVVCPECGTTYADMWWETVIAHEPHLQCPCGEQFTTTPED